MKKIDASYEYERYYTYKMEDLDKNSFKKSFINILKVVDDFACLTKISILL